MTYEQAVQERDRLEAEMKEASRAIQAFPQLSNGLHSDDVKATPEYQVAKSRYYAAFAKLRAFNAKFVKDFRKERRGN